MKLEELCRRADEKQKQINDIAKKIHGGHDATSTSFARGGDPTSTQQLNQTQLDNLET